MDDGKWTNGMVMTGQPRLANPAPPSRDAQITAQFDTDVYRGSV